MNEISKVFKHLSRDLFVYFLVGFIVLINLAYLDYIFNGATTLLYVKAIPYWTVILLIMSFTVGHIVFALMYFIFEFSTLEDWLKKILFPIGNGDKNSTSFQIDYEKEINIFINTIELHEQFVERHTQLYLMRWNFSAGLIFSGLTNFIFEIVFHFSCRLTILSILFILFGFLLYILSLKTEKDCFDRINKIDNAIKSK